MELSQLQEITQQEIERRKPIRILCCSAAGCKSSGSEGIVQQLKTAIEAKGLKDQVEVCNVGCMRFCGRGPLVEISPQRILYENVQPEDTDSIIDALESGETTATRGDYNHPFFAYQMPIVLENSGKINPERIEEYIAVGGYQQLSRVLQEMTPAEVLQEVSISGLRGRGGGGYPTGLKWNTVAKMPGEQKICCL